MNIISLTMLHGSPYSNLKFEDSQLLFLTQSQKVAEAYALGKVFNTGKFSGKQRPTIYIPLRLRLGSAILKTLRY